MRLAPPSPKMWCCSPHFGQMKTDMFSTIPRIGTFTFWNMRRPFFASMSAMSCGVVTTTAPVMGTDCESVS